LFCAGRPLAPSCPARSSGAIGREELALLSMWCYRNLASYPAFATCNACKDAMPGRSPSAPNALPESAGKRFSSKYVCTTDRCELVSYIPTVNMKPTPKGRNKILEPNESPAKGCDQVEKPCQGKVLEMPSPLLSCPLQ
jgi:hypothetical protein